MSIREDFFDLTTDKLKTDDIYIRAIKDDYDLWFATEECRLKPGQDQLVNRAGFTIGRAYLNPDDNIPCLVCLSSDERIGYIVFRKWYDGNAYSFSCYLDADWQGKGYGKKTVNLAIKILKEANPDMPIKLAAEVANTLAHRLYQSVGFILLDEKDGDDLVFEYK